MKRPWAAAIAAAVLVGCQSSQPNTNPFLRTTVAPPATGPTVVTQGEPYYPPGTAAPQAIPQMAPQVAPDTAPQAVAPAVPAAPAVIMPAPPPAVAPPIVAPPPNNKYAPPGGSYQYNQSSLDRSKNGDRLAAAKSKLQGEPIAPNTVEQALQLTKDADPLASGEAVPSTDSDAEPLADAGLAEPPDPEPVASAKPRASTGAVLATHSEMVEDSADDSLAANSDASQSDQAPTNVAKSASGRTVARRLATADTPEDGTNEAAPYQADRIVATTSLVDPASAATGRADYAHADDYSWLRGRLEQSRVSGQWKLRYIPIDGQTDRFGGSVVLPDASALAAFKPGDRVTVRGTLGTGNSKAGSFSPLYQLAQIAPAAR